MASYYDSWINDLKDELATAPDEYPAAGDYTGDTFIGSIGDTRFTVSTPSEKMVQPDIPCILRMIS